MIYHEPTLFPDLSVAENIVMGRHPRRRLGMIDRGAIRAEAEKPFARLGVRVDPGRPARGLSIADQQIVEIAKSLSADARVLIMDEPTAALALAEVWRLFAVVRALRDEGAAIMFISHRFEEITERCQRVTILRDGRHVSTDPIEDPTVDETVRRMVGRELDALFPNQDVTPGEVVLEVEGLSRDGVFHDVSFSVRAGEFVAFAGLVGSGRSEVAQAVFGVDERDAGVVRLHGKELKPNSPRAGMALVPGDRRQQDLVMDLSIERNVTLPRSKAVASLGFLFGAGERREALRWMTRLQTKFGGRVRVGLRVRLRRTAGRNRMSRLFVDKRDVIDLPDIAAAKQALWAQWIETPSWAYGNSGTRFKVFAQKGVPRTPEEKIEDAATVNRFTGVARSVALHIPWDRVDDYGALARHAEDLGVKIGAINTNVFQDDDYKLGSVTNPDPGIRRKATGHLLEAISIMDATGSRDLKLWFSDGLNYPGQDDLRDRQDRLAAALRETYDRLGDGQRILLEYKLFEPAFYATDVPDWGTAYAHCAELGPKATVCIDTGHHAPGTNIEVIVAFLLRRKKLGAFDFNSRFYADDDLMAGAADPFQLFRIMYEIVRGEALDPGYGISFMLDQCHNIEPKIPAVIRSVLNVQEATAKALLVDREALHAAQRGGDVLGANAVLMDAFNTDVRPLLAELRTEMGLDPDPVAAYHRSGYQQRIETGRADGRQAGWGA